MKKLKETAIFLSILIIVFGGFYFITQNINNNARAVHSLLPDNGIGQLLALIYLMSPIIFPAIIYFLWTSLSEYKDSDYKSKTVTQIESFKYLDNIEKNKKPITMTQKEQISEVMNAFTKIANINDYVESFGDGNLKMSSSNKKIEITISKPKSEPFPEFLNVNILNNSKKIELDIYTKILVDICNHLGLMDSKLQMKFDLLTSEKAQTIIVNGKEYKLA